MRLVQALSEGNPDSSSAVNRSGKSAIRVVNAVGASGLTAYEVDEHAANPDDSVTRRLVTNDSAEDLETFLEQQGYGLDADEWYPG